MTKKPYYKRAHYRRSKRGNYIRLKDGSYMEVEPGMGNYTRIEGKVINSENIPESKSLWDDNVLLENRMIGGD